MTERENKKRETEKMRKSEKRSVMRNKLVFVVLSGGGGQLTTSQFLKRDEILPIIFFSEVSAILNFA